MENLPSNCTPIIKMNFSAGGHKKIEYSNKISGEVSKKFSYEDITNKIINLFETEDKNKNLSDKLNKTNIFLKK